ncbi:putative white-collar-1a protein [Phascolomyces articulosus]|uniref:White-collar-1a protein n=1 Tax=Phascolomyces articulosus TaxID=60185 RepID=A0AAD5PIW9_9FUNG|nr:putative white-collar-1a protein [Phascolomyces articulosus]
MDIASDQKDPILQNDQVSFAGLYSNSGFDMISILARILNRPNPQINIGPIDMSCSFLVTDMRKFDCPIVYCSPNFETLTGYRSKDIIGRNCRFLQAPDGQVTMGSRRQHTDNVAVYHLKSYLEQGKEHQASIINYRKGGQPFVNLVTVIPVPDETHQTAFLVGLQVDLVEQPNAILEKMKDGTYCVNYQQINIPPYIPGSGTAVDPVDDYFREIPSLPITASSSITRPEIVRLVSCDGQNEQQLQQEWNKLLIDQSVDFIHVLSLKGFFLYCSRSCSSILEYDPEELVGHSLSSITHPSDIVPVMRDIKNAASESDRIISFLFRIRRKYSGYMWIECQGKLHADQSKGRKCLILAGRERPVYRLPFKEVTNANESNFIPYHSANPLTTEFWSKMSLEGLYLRVTSPSMDIIGHSNDGLQGSSIYRYAGDDNIPNIARALISVSKGCIINLQHTMRNQRGQYIPVTSTFYPGDAANGIGKPTFALVQTRLQTFDKGTYVKNVPFVDPTRTGDENLFPELETVRGTSWQYELHQLQQANAKLRLQIEKLNKDKKNQKKKGSSSGDKQELTCAQCHRTSSPEWRKGPNRPRELCNGCGLKYAKSLQANKATTATRTTE